MTARDALAGASPLPDPDPRPPDRTPASTAAQSKRRVQQTCVVCGAAYLIAPAAARACQTCSRACSTQLRSRQRTGRPLSRTKDVAPARPQAAQDPARRPDIAVVGRRHLRVACIRCGGLRGTWGVREMPPPELCWLCLMRQNAGLGPGLPPG